jgi:hypothetical protein
VHDNSVHAHHNDRACRGSFHIRRCSVAPAYNSRSAGWLRVAKLVRALLTARVAGMFQSLFGLSVHDVPCAPPNGSVRCSGCIRSASRAPCALSKRRCGSSPFVHAHRWHRCVTFEQTADCSVHVPCALTTSVRIMEIGIITCCPWQPAALSEAPLLHAAYNSVHSLVLDGRFRALLGLLRQCSIAHNY